MKLAVRRLETGRVRKVAVGTRLSISAVAREAWIDPATIHTAYPDIAELIGKMMGRETRAQRDSKASELRETRRRLAELRTEGTALKQELAALASRHATLLIEAEQLRASLPNQYAISLTLRTYRRQAFGGAFAPTARVARARPTRSLRRCPR